MITGCSCSGVYNGNLTIEKNVEIPEGQWLIVDGDLLIQPLDMFYLG
ncbi:hypothetical protein KHA80_17025 [Anaerobacillus sp. HL2]|nr:hypothetical protein KHA80_17025 [Anaerobacillus sp. HL2]